MTFADLTDTNYRFSLEFSGDAVDYFDFTFTASWRDENDYRELSRCEIDQLRDNCRRILEATKSIDGGY
jgi:hypothetical protein